MAKELTVIQIKQTIGQLEASINKIEDRISLEEFKDYCDGIRISITYWQVELKKLKDG